MSARVPALGDVYQFNRLIPNQEILWIVIGRRPENRRLVTLVPFLIESANGAHLVPPVLDESNWRLYRRIVLCVHEADFDDKDAVAAMKLDVAQIEVRTGGSEELCDTEKEEELERVRDAIESVLHFAGDANSYLPTLSECDLAGICWANKKISFHWRLDRNRVYEVSEATGGGYNIRQSYSAPDSVSDDLRLPLRVDSDVIEFEENGTGKIGRDLVTRVEERFAKKGFFKAENARGTRGLFRIIDVSRLKHLMSHPIFVPAMLAMFVTSVVIIAIYGPPGASGDPEFVVVSATVREATSGAEEGFRGLEVGGADILAVGVSTESVHAVAKDLTTRMRGLGALVVQRDIGDSRVQLMVAAPGDPMVAAEIFQIFGQPKLPQRLLLVEISRPITD